MLDYYDDRRLVDGERVEDFFRVDAPAAEHGEVEPEGVDCVEAVYYEDEE